MSDPIDPRASCGARLMITGAVQGVGFRPFIYRLAAELGLMGCVSNTAQGVCIDVDGDRARIEQFIGRIEKERPPLSILQSIEIAWSAPAGHRSFEIRQSDGEGEKSVQVLPDIATCEECLAEIQDASNRRFRYPFTNCTNCGPRFSIIEALPYDRINTSMNVFEMCPDCRAEYENPRNRRFHAQPNACPVCGPHLAFWDAAGPASGGVATRDEALVRAAAALRGGQIVAVKGLGGFHLMVDGRDEAGVTRLRRRKHREEKPLALMFPDLASIEAECCISELERRLLISPEAPIVLLKRRGNCVAQAVAPANPYLGAMLPYSPLHHLLMRELELPVVATSGNLSEEPICTDEHEALDRLRGIADGFLVHNRRIVRHVDDSVVRLMAGRELVVRRARGFAPLPIQTKDAGPVLLAVGAHLKNAVALAQRHNVFISQHIGDLETVQAYEAFQRAAKSLQVLYDVRPRGVACDLHPDYLSTKYAVQLGLPTFPVQHHFAHVVACMAEHDLEGPVLGVSWDGTGYGPDGTVWGGEFLLATRSGFERLAHFRTFPLPGGDAAVKEPRRTALGMLYEAYGDETFERADLTALAPMQAFSSAERRLMQRMLQRGINTPRTSSAGRLFDGVASLAGLRQRLGFEGQAAMELEFALPEMAIEEAYPIDMVESEEGRGPWQIGWRRLLEQVLEDLRNGVATSRISAKFHNALVESIVAVSKKSRQQNVILTGGCFQNRYLTERAVQRLAAEGLVPFWHRRVPPNDGGIALGQAVAAALAARKALPQGKGDPIACA